MEVVHVLRDDGHLEFRLQLGDDAVCLIGGGPHEGLAALVVKFEHALWIARPRLRGGNVLNAVSLPQSVRGAKSGDAALSARSGSTENDDVFHGGIQYHTPLKLAPTSEHGSDWGAACGGRFAPGALTFSRPAGRMKLRGLRDTGELWKFSNTMTKRSLISSSLWLLLGGFTALHAQNAPAPAEPPAAQSPAPAPAPARELAVVRTSKGEMTIEFWEDVAPKTVANFKELAKKGFYNGTAFHRIIKGFMIQGGDPLSKDPSKEAMYGTGDPGYKIKAEFNEKKHVRGVISMARAFDPDSAGSQFFICLDAAPNLDRQYTGFGRLVKGEDVLVAIGDTPVASNGRERSRPAERVTVESVKIVPASDTAAPAPAPAAPAAQPAPAPPAK